MLNTIGVRSRETADHDQIVKFYFVQMIMIGPLGGKAFDGSKILDCFEQVDPGSENSVFTAGRIKGGSVGKVETGRVNVGTVNNS